MLISAEKCQKAGFNSVCATIRTRRENRCIPYARFFLYYFLDRIIQLIRNILEVESQLVVRLVSQAVSTDSVSSYNL